MGGNRSLFSCMGVEAWVSALTGEIAVLQAYQPRRGQSGSLAPGSSMPIHDDALIGLFLVGSRGNISRQPESSRPDGGFADGAKWVGGIHLLHSEPTPPKGRRNTGIHSRYAMPDVPAMAA